MNTADIHTQVSLILAHTEHSHPVFWGLVLGGFVFVFFFIGLQSSLYSLTQSLSKCLLGFLVNPLIT